MVSGGAAVRPRGTVRCYGKGGKPRETERHAELRETYAAWITTRAGWPGADTQPEFFHYRPRPRPARCSRRPRRPRRIRHEPRQAGLVNEASARVLRRTVATTLVPVGPIWS